MYNYGNSVINIFLKGNVHQNVKIDNELNKLLHTIYNFRACLYNFMCICFHFVYVIFLVEKFRIV